LQKYFVLSWVLSLFLLGSCQDTSPVLPTATKTEYFDIAGFIQEQVRLLNTEKPAAIKSVQESGETTETKTVKNLNWTKELESFAEIDLNKPAFRDAYTVSRQAQPDGTITETYRRKPDTESDIQLVTVTTNGQKQVASIQAIRESDNMLLASRKEMQLTCNTKNNVNRVQSFRIEGEQKPLIFENLHYIIATEILIATEIR